MNIINIIYNCLIILENKWYSSRYFKHIDYIHGVKKENYNTKVYDIFITLRNIAINSNIVFIDYLSN